MATSPRLYVDGVDAYIFKVGKKPVFFVKIVNSGPADAEEVTISIKATSPDGGVAYQTDQVMMIPAQGYRRLPIIAEFTFDEAEMDKLNKGLLPLEISGHFIHQGKTTHYYYKYNPWPLDDPRPSDFPLFVSREFNTNRRIDVNVALKGAGMSAFAGNLDVKIIPASDKPSENPPK